MSALRGLYVATLTPFDEVNRLDLPAIRAHVRFLVGAGVDGLAPCGTTGEFLYLNTGEKVRLVEETIRAADGKVPVMAGVWALIARETALLARAAEAAGAAAVFLPPPIYYPADDDTVFRWYAAVRESTALPVFAYNIPAYAANAISVECVERLVAEGIIAGIKDSTGKADRIQELITQFGDKITVMAASDGFVSEARNLGAHGFISALANVYPKAMLRAWNGDESVQPEVGALRSEVKAAGGIPAIKLLGEALGLCPALSRVPSSPITERQKERLMAAASALRED